MNVEQFSAGGVASNAAAAGSIVAWVAFNGTGTVAIIASGNVSSITDNGVGDYTINFSQNLADANYALAGIGSGLSYKDLVAIHAASEGGAATTKTVSACRIIVGRTEGTSTDGAIITVIFVR